MYSLVCSQEKLWFFVLTYSTNEFISASNKQVQLKHHCTHLEVIFKEHKKGNLLSTIFPL